MKLGLIVPLHCHETWLDCCFGCDFVLSLFKFHVLIDSCTHYFNSPLDSQAALSTFYPNNCVPRREAVCIIFSHTQRVSVTLAITLCPSSLLSLLASA